METLQPNSLPSDQSQVALEEVTIETIVSAFKNTRDKKRLRDIKEAVLSHVCPSGCDDDIKNAVFSRVEFLMKIDKKEGDQSHLSYSKGFYRKRAIKANINTLESGLTSDYIGRAGECAVMSELMFRGYNANRMMIDDGVDIIAVKDNLYFYVQVKTTHIKDGRIYVQLSSDKFAQFMSAQIRYIIVARYTESNLERNMFFQLTPSLIQQGVHQHFIKKSDKGVSIKIKFHERSGEPILYDEKEMMIDFYKNNFNL